MGRHASILVMSYQINSFFPCEIWSTMWKHHQSQENFKKIWSGLCKNMRKFGEHRHSVYILLFYCHRTFDKGSSANIYQKIKLPQGKGSWGNIYCVLYGVQFSIWGYTPRSILCSLLLLRVRAGYSSYCWDFSNKIITISLSIF